MQLTVTTETDSIIQVQVQKETSIEDLKAILEVDTQILSQEQLLIYNTQQLQNNKNVGDYNIADGDLLQVYKRVQPRPQQQGQNQFGASAPLQRGPAVNSYDTTQINQFIDMVNSSPQMMNTLRDRSPQFVRAIESRDIDAVRQALQQFQQTSQGSNMFNQNQPSPLEQEILRLQGADSMDVEAQEKIEQYIKQQNIQQNINLAIENTPESFAQVTMLFVNLKVNNQSVKAFIDSGAQATIMSQACAEKCNLMHLVDTRMAGIAVGVGTAKFLGRVHAAYIYVQGEVVQTSISILEGTNKPDFIFGLDMLRRHQCQIDLKKNVLVFGSIDVAIPFLPEHEIVNEFSLASISNMMNASRNSSQEAGNLTGTPAVNGQPLSSQIKASSQQVKQPQQPQGIQQNLQNQQMTPGQGQSQNNFSDDKIQQLINLGFSKEQSVEALQICQGNVEQAAAYLFQ